MNTKNASILIGAVFIAVGILGFIPNPIIGLHNALFHADATHNMVHIVSGALFLIVALAAPAKTRKLLKVFGVVYFLIGIMGLTMIGSDEHIRLLGFLHVNAADNYLHIVLGIVIFLAGLLPGWNLPKPA
jgi:hypothetical protein